MMRGMHTNDYPWSEGKCVLRGNDWFFVDKCTGIGTFIENAGLVLDLDHLQFLVVQALVKRSLVGMN